VGADLRIMYFIVVHCAARGVVSGSLGGGSTITHTLWPIGIMFDG
jgi:hypothetical protein